MLEDVGLSMQPMDTTFSDGVQRSILLRIARVIADTPGVATFCETSGHSGGRFISFCVMILYSAGQLQ